MPPAGPGGRGVGVRAGDRWLAGAGVQAAGVFALALALRLLLLAFDPVPPFAKYPLAAERLLAGTLPAERVLDLSLLYLGVHAVARWLFGEGAVQAVLVLHALAGAGTAALTQVLGGRLFGRAAGLGAGLLVAGLRPGLVLDRVLEPETFVVLGGIAWLLALDVGLERRARPTIAVAGAVFVLAVALRPTALVGGVVVLGLWWQRAGASRERAAAALSFCGGAVAIVLPAVVAATSVTGRVPTPPMNPGVVFHVGNNPLSRGIGAAYPPLLKELEALQPEGESDYGHVVYRQMATAALGRPAARAEAASLFRDLSLAFLADHPRQALRLLGLKARALVAASEHHDLASSTWSSRRLASVLVPGWGVLWPLAFGALAFAATTWRRGWPAPAMASALAVTPLAFYVSERHRLPLLPFLALVAAQGLLLAWRHGRRRRWRPLGRWTALVLLGAAASLPPSDVALEDARAWDHARAVRLHQGRARRALAEGDLQRAREHVAAALALVPSDAHRLRLAGVPDPWPVATRARAALVTTPSDLFDLGLLRLEAGDAEGALADFRRVAATGFSPWREFRESPSPRCHAGRALVRLGRLPEAWDEYEAARRETPGEVRLLARRAALLARMGRHEAAALELARLHRHADPVTARQLHGEALHEAGLHAEAAAELGWVTDRLPTLRRAHVWRAAALGRAGRYAEGARHVALALELSPRTVWREADLLHLARGLAAERPGDPDAARFRAGVEAFVGGVSAAED